ncbi:MAG: hypothetical protein WD360_04915 [Nitriliruptoraceae bacterium]
MFDASLSDIAAFLRVVFGVGIVFVVLPLVVLPRPAGTRNMFDVWVANVARWLAILIVLVHVLGGMRAYSRVSLMVSVLLIAWFLRYRKQFGGMAGVMEQIYRRKDLPSKSESAPVPLSQRLKELALASPVLGIFIASYFLRAKDAFGSYALSPPDAYIHMSWANSFANGSVWPDGVYPQGLAAVVAAVHTFTPFTDILDVARFMGPMVGTSLVVGIYYAVVRLTRNPGAALFAAALIGLFGAMPEWRTPWERYVGLLPQEFGLTLAFFGVVFAVLAVTERGGGRLLGLGAAGGIAMNGNVLSLAAAGFAAAMVHPLSAAWFGVIVGVAAIAATMLSFRFAQLVGAGVATVAGVGIGVAVVPVAELLGVPPYLGYGTGSAFSDFASVSNVEQSEDLLKWFGDLAWLGHNWVSRTAMIAVALSLVGVVALAARKATRTHAAQLLGLAAVGALAAFAYNLNPVADRVDAFYVTRLGNLLGQTLPLAYGAALGGLAVIIAKRVSFARIAALSGVGLIALAGFAYQLDSPTRAMGAEFEREEIEYDEMTRATIRLKHEFERGTYTVVGPTSQRQVLADHGWFVEQWVFARDIGDIPNDELLPIPTPDTIVFVELDPLPIREISQNSPSAEYYFNQDKRGRIQTILYEWAELRRRDNPDTTIYFDGEHIRAYRISRNPAIQIDPDTTAFLDGQWLPGELFNEGPTSPRAIQDQIERLPEPAFDDDKKSS